jgi:hypothetical protein
LRLGPERFDVDFERLERIRLFLDAAEPREQELPILRIRQAGNERARDCSPQQGRDRVLHEGAVFLFVAACGGEADDPLDVGEGRDGRDERDMAGELRTRSGDERDARTGRGADQRDAPVAHVGPRSRRLDDGGSRLQGADSELAGPQSRKIRDDCNVPRARETERHALHDRLLPTQWMRARYEDEGGPGPPAGGAGHFDRDAVDVETLAPWPARETCRHARKQRKVHDDRQEHE